MSSVDEPIEMGTVFNNEDESGIEMIPAVIHEEGWSTPRKLGFNDAGWEDSPYLTRDGKQLLFLYHPWGDLVVQSRAEELTNILIFEPKKALREGLDPRTYYSNYPFDDKHLHPISQNKSYPTYEACPYISLAGDIFYCGNLEAYILQKSIPGSIYKNDERLYFNTGGEEGNPHYCEAKDEMWFDCPGDENICVVSDLEKNGWEGNGTLAPYPINFPGEVQDFQPFLTDDCMTLYFSSNRDGKNQVYRTNRLKNSWSEPELFISHPVGIGEFTMTSNGKAMSFVQLFWKEDVETLGIDVWYSEKR